MKKPSDYHKEGYTCGEAILLGREMEHGINMPIGLGSSMGVGFGTGSLCGAVGAAAVVIGYLHGRQNKDEANVAIKHTRELIQNVRQKFGTEICRELKKNGVSCAEIIEYTYDTLNDILKNSK